ncbi:MAG: protease modulator HflC [Eubacteriales bacterium]|nr:protease modulator HflC [Eubacteriales bacterium]
MNEQVKVKHKRPVAFTVLKYVVAAILVIILVYFGFTCEVREGSCAVILRFGAVRQEITEAGLYFRLPWPFETVVTYDNRLQYLESNYLETTTKDKRNVIIQSYVVWSISDPVLYHNSVGSQGKVDTYIKDQVFSATNSVMGAYELSALVSLEKEQIKTEEIQNEIFNRVKQKCAANYGIEVSDVSILRLSLPDTNLESVFEQMRADRQKDIDTILANAQRDANKITSDADAEAAKIVADGVTAAAEIKAKTETEVARIYAEAQAANLELYQFLKQLDTVVASVGDTTVLVVKADEYPFKVLTEYGDYLTDEGDEIVIKDLEYILTQLNETDRAALIDAVSTLIASAAVEGGYK